MGCGGSKATHDVVAVNDFFGNQQDDDDPPKPQQSERSVPAAAPTPPPPAPPASSTKSNQSKAYKSPEPPEHHTSSNNSSSKKRTSKPLSTTSTYQPPASTDSFLPPTAPPPPPPPPAQPQPSLEHIPYEDDDFSVAPSLATGYRSIVKTSFDDIYSRGQKLGYGAFAQVFIGRHKPTSQEYAIKQVDRSKMMWGERDALQDEISNLKALREGPNITQLYEVFEEPKYCYLVMELLGGGELFDRIIEKKTFSENEARDCVQCVLSALEYMHQRRVAHRDLKPENLLLADKNDLVPVKLADFGFAKTVGKKNGCRTLCGTPGYLAPEILERWPAYDVKCDVWSIGVILFLLLGGYLPFDDEDEEKVFDRTRNAQYDFRPQYWRNISNGAKDLVTKCLTINPQKRISASRALAHDWMSVSSKDLKDQQLDVDKLKNLVQAKKKMKLAMHALTAANRLQQLNDDFSTYLEHKRKDSGASTLSFMTSATGKMTVANFKEDGSSGRPFKSLYDELDLLDMGDAFAVYRCRRKSTRMEYAVRFVSKQKLDKAEQAAFKDELTALRLLRGGPNIIRLFDLFQEPKMTFLIFDDMKGGNLLERIAGRASYSEREARRACSVVYQAINYCHKKHIAHRDIKPENILFADQEDESSIKICEFSFSKKVLGENSLVTICGSPHYAAPEILDPRVAGYDHRADVWSLGVLTYVLLGGYYPFDGEMKTLAKKIMNGHFTFDDYQWKKVSPAAKQLIERMLQVRPEDRCTASDALSCKWMETEEESLSLKDLSFAQDKIKTLAKQRSVENSNSRNKFTSLEKLVNTESNKKHSLDMDQDDLVSFHDDYEWGEQIGIGTFSVVHECVKKSTTTTDITDTFAVKRVPRKDLHPSDAVALHDEITALQTMSTCEQIVKLYSVYDEPDFTYLVLECMKGGDLIDRIIEKRSYTEFDAKEVTRQLIRGVAFCHKKKIANRNLKPENLLLKQGSDTDVKISDFGYAKTVTFPNSLRTQCGTEGYVAPEILAHRPAYDVPCDMWSLGVIVYIVLGGYRPFRGEGDEVMKQIRYGEYKFHKRYWSHVSNEAKDLIRGMLTVDPEDRITAEEALNSPWIQADGSKLGKNSLTDNMKHEDMMALRAAKARAKFKGVVNTIIATNKLTSLGEYRAFQDF